MFSRFYRFPFFSSPRSSIRTIGTLARLAVSRGLPPLDISRGVFLHEGPLSRAVQRGRLRNPAKSVNLYVQREPT